MYIYMVDLTLPLVGLTGLVGYYLKRSRTEKYKNIYYSNLVDESKQKLQEDMINRYKDAENPDFSGIYNPYNQNTKMGLNFDSNPLKSKSSNMKSQFEDSRYTLDARIPSNQVTSIPTQEPIKVTPAYSGNYFTYENNKDTTISKLTGLPIELNPGTMPNNTKNRYIKENFSMLENMGTKQNNIRYKSKEEVTNTNQGSIVNNVHVKDAYVMDKSRFIPSMFKQGEKPFQEQREHADIAGTIHNEIRPQYKTIDDLVVNTKESYKGRVIKGIQPSTVVAGTLGILQDNRAPTFYKAGESHFIPGTGAFKSNTQYGSQNDKITSREFYSSKTYSAPMSSVIPEITSRNQKYTDSIKSIYSGQVLAPTSVDVFVNKDNKNSHNVPLTDRETKSQVMNANLEKIGTRTEFSKPKDTLRQINDSQPFNLNLTNTVSKDNYTNGLTTIVNKNTMKQSIGYTPGPQLNGTRGIGAYDTQTMNFKTTLKELFIDNNRENAPTGLPEFTSRDHIETYDHIPGDIKETAVSHTVVNSAGRSGLTTGISQLGSIKIKNNLDNISHLNSGKSHVEMPSGTIGIRTNSKQEVSQRSVSQNPIVDYNKINYQRI